MKKLIWAALLFGASAYGQASNPSIVAVSSAPSGTCASGLPNQQVITTGTQYSCQSGTWGAIGGSGSFTALSGDATSTATGGATSVVGLKGVPFCTGFTPTNGQALQYTTGSSPNPCYTASTISGTPSFSAITSGTNTTGLVMGSGGVFSFSGTGLINANEINAVQLSTLATGIVKNTTTTGVPSIAVAADFPTLNQNTTGTASNVSGTPALPNGTTATTQTAGDNTTKLATTAFVSANGTVSNCATANLFAFYSAIGTTVSCNTLLGDDGTTLTYLGAGGINAAKFTSTGAPGLTFAAQTSAPGVAGSVVWTVDATSGFGEVNENNTGNSRVCTAANGICASGGLPTGTTGQTVYYAAGGTTGTATSAITIKSASTGSPVGINNTSPLSALDSVGAATFTWIAGISLATSGSTTSGATSITTTNTTNVPATGGVFLLGGNGSGTQEFVFCTAASGTTISGCTRGRWGTTAAAQSTGTPILLVEYAVAQSATTTPVDILLSNAARIINGGNSTFNNAGNLANNTTVGNVGVGEIFFGSTPNGSPQINTQNGGLFMQNSGAKVVALTDGSTPTVLTTNTTITATSITAGASASTGLALNSIPNTGQTNLNKGECHVSWSQSTAVATATFGFGLSAGVTALWVQNPEIWNGTTLTKNATSTTITGTTATAITSAITPSVAATNYTLDIYFSMSSNSVSPVLTLYGITSNASDALVINAGSWCGWEM